VKLLDSLLGRSKPVPAKLDALFALPGAAVTLETEVGLAPTGRAAVCFKPITGQSFRAVKDELDQLLRLAAGAPGAGARAHQGETTGSSGTTAPVLHEQADEYGYHWVVLQDTDPSNLVTRVHLVNSTLDEHGFGPELLCSVFGFAGSSSSEKLYLVYLFKRGTFYPFAPAAGEQRDNPLELRIRGMLADDLTVESDLARWFPLWGLPI